MGLADGDAFVSGSILSYQQAERIRDNWRGASAPSNPQAGSLFSDSDDEKLYHRQASAWMVVMQADNSLISTLAAGGDAFTIDAYQDDTTALTGLLRGAYIQASNGDEACTGIIRALELKARAGRPGETGANVAHLEGLSISADAKTYDITTVMRGAEVILDGGSGASIVKAVGIRIANNFQADIATLCYGLEIYRDSFDYDADIALSSGGLIGGKAGHLRLTDEGILELYEDAMVDKFFMYHDGTNAYFKWTDGYLIFISDEGTNADTYFDIKGKGTGKGYLRIFDEDDAEWLNLRSVGGVGYISVEGSVPGKLQIQSSIAQDVRIWNYIASGNPYFYVYGYKTAVGLKYLRFRVTTLGQAQIDVQDIGALCFAGNPILTWGSGGPSIPDDIPLRFGTHGDMCLGYLNTGDIWHLCDQVTLGSNIRMSINATGLSFFGEAPVAQAGHIGDTGGDDAAVVNAILVVLEDLGLIADA